MHILQLQGIENGHKMNIKSGHKMKYFLQLKSTYLDDSLKYKYSSIVSQAGALSQVKVIKMKLNAG